MVSFKFQIINKLKNIIQLKILTAMRAGQKQKKIDITIPKLNDFIHNVYVHTARKLYKSIYLFELNIPPLQKQKYNREFEILIQESILNAVRDSIPIESILRAYMDESIEEQVTEEIKEEVIMDKETETNKDVKEIIEDSVNTGAISREVEPTDNSSVSASIPNNKLSFSEELEKINSDISTYTGFINQDDYPNDGLSKSKLLVKGKLEEIEYVSSKYLLNRKKQNEDIRKQLTAYSDILKLKKDSLQTQIELLK
jgi:hypothetical protein